ncbi:hypothetical protein SAY86_008479 [Trapa natans]|uniref:Potassium transporter n=1 Tax=Trapa natans TaxID=22666 RepID=A0AAN7KET7_TRANT|nr:hypothetical protein SAY86_008479 [Trapa natans]
MAESKVGREENGQVEMQEEEIEEVAAFPRDRKMSWAKLRRVDSLNLEAGRFSMAHGHHSSQVNWARTLSLAFQSIGVVYGDIGTSPLYVFSSTFGDHIDHKDDILGVLSLIIYTIALIPLIKYVFIVLRANDNGDGGTFALYSVICRYAKVSLIPNHQPEDTQLSHYKLDTPSRQLKRSQMIKEKIENSRTAKMILFLVTIMGTSMVIGDGVLTPSISVLSAVGGIKSLGQDAVVGISIAILVTLFSIQRFGTDKIGFSFAPIVFIWFSFIGGIGLFNLFKYDVGVLRAFNPKYIVDYFQRNGKQAWVSLGGVFLCITGTEAMFADLGHFNIRAIQISFSCITFPAIVTAYIGQAAFLTKHPDQVSDTFYKSIPGELHIPYTIKITRYPKLSYTWVQYCVGLCYVDPLYWPVFVSAVAATIVASQAMISGAFAIVSQSLTLGCFPRVKVVHTSTKYEGQVYIPEVNYILMVACVIVTAAFKTTDKIGNAYGIAVVSVMLITTGMVSLIMLVIWKTNVWWIAIFFFVFGSIEVLYLSSVLYKFVQGGFLPLLFSLVLMTAMIIWHYVHKERYMYELNHKASGDFVGDLAKNAQVTRLPGIGLLYSELVQGIPPILPHFVSNIPSVHSVLIIVSIKNLPISKVLPQERFLFRQMEPRHFRVFRCVVRYGYKDAVQEPAEFERDMVESLKEFIRRESCFFESTKNHKLEPVSLADSSLLAGEEKANGSAAESLREPINSNHETCPSSDSSLNAIRSAVSSAQGVIGRDEGAEAEMEFVQVAAEKGVVYLIGEAEVVAKPSSSFLKKIVVNYAYSFLRKNFRQGEKVMAIPRTKLLRVGMTYEI